MRKILAKASEEKEAFFDLIYKDVTFACELMSIGGHITHKKGEKGYISDVEYTPGYWSTLCPDIYVKPKISTLKINGMPGICFRPDTFEEFKSGTYKTESNG